MAVKKDLRKKVQMQNMIILALAIIILVLVIVSSTAAWYIRTKSDSADIVLSNPVNIYITEFEDLLDSDGNPVLDIDGNNIKNHSLKTDILENYNTKIYPGDKIKMSLGMQIGTQEEESSPAYVRVKLTCTWENIYTGEISGLENMGEQNLIKYKDKPDTDIWELVDFNKYSTDEDAEPDYWYVLKTTDDDGNLTARIAQNMEQFVFVDGYIELSKTEITNAQANCKFHINYIVEAIQTVNVPNPLYYEGYGPWWNYALGDTEELGM